MNHFLSCLPVWSSDFILLFSLVSTCLSILLVALVNDCGVEDTVLIDDILINDEFAAKLRVWLHIPRTAKWSNSHMDCTPASLCNKFRSVYTGTAIHNVNGLQQSNFCSRLYTFSIVSKNADNLTHRFKFGTAHPMPQKVAHRSGLRFATASLEHGFVVTFAREFDAQPRVMYS